MNNKIYFNNILQDNMNALMSVCAVFFLCLESDYQKELGHGVGHSLTALKRSWGHMVGTQPTLIRDMGWDTHNNYSNNYLLITNFKKRNNKENCITKEMLNTFLQEYNFLHPFSFLLTRRNVL